jgi:hypothetical protein
VRLDHLLSMETDRPLTTAPLSLCDFLVVQSGKPGGSMGL